MTKSYSFTRARSRPTFHNTMTRKSKPDVSESDVSPKKMKIQKKPHRYLTKPDKIVRSYNGGHYALTAVSTFQNRWVVLLHVEHPFEIVYVGRHEDLCTFSMGNNIGKVLSVILSQWLKLS